MESSNTSSSNSYQESFSSFLNLPQPPPPPPPPPTTTTTFSSSLQPPPPPPPPPPPQPSRPSNTTTSSSTTAKKRTRASRRAPTTVLTTDTSNFRAMVQEFTGFPPPPFSSNPNPNSHPSSSSFSLPPRLDLLPSSPYFNLSKLLDQRLLNASASTSSNYHFMGGGGSSSNAHNHPPPLDHLAPQFGGGGGGDLGSLMATTMSNITSTSAQAMQNWDHQDQERDREALILTSIPHGEELIQPQKRLKTTQGMVESWLHSSDE